VQKYSEGDERMLQGRASLSLGECLKEQIEMTAFLPINILPPEPPLKEQNRIPMHSFFSCKRRGNK
jgi:hypothetical protein